MILFHNWTNH